ncbi:MAG TPA: hypothetical protein VI584_05290 [Nitrospiria bacterium]|nr:hypothetical protein [Nitrospiria bacterium]
MTLKTISLPVKVLFTCFLLTIGIGYLSAITYLFLIDIEPHAKDNMGIVQAVIIKYYGQRGTTRLEASMEGSMGDNVTPAQKRQIAEWIRKGAPSTGFESIKEIFLNNCASCHSKESGMPVSSLGTYEEVTAYTRIDLGQSIKSLVRVSHIHIFGMSFIFILTSWIFVLSEVAVGWKALLVAIPFFAIWIDIGSWWVTRFEPFFAYTVIAGGVLMGFSLAAQILISLWEIWFGKRVE